MLSPSRPGFSLILPLSYESLGQLFNFAQLHFLTFKMRIKTVLTVGIQRDLINGGLPSHQVLTKLENTTQS